MVCTVTNFKDGIATTQEFRLRWPPVQIGTSYQFNGIRIGKPVERPMTPEEIERHPRHAEKPASP